MYRVTGESLGVLVGSLPLVLPQETAIESNGDKSDTILSLYLVPISILSLELGSSSPKANVEGKKAIPWKGSQLASFWHFRLALKPFFLFHT